MKHVKTLSSNTLKNSMKKGGCGECQTSCQSACKTSCTVGNQSCENSNREWRGPVQSGTLKDDPYGPMIVGVFIVSKEDV